MILGLGFTIRPLVIAVFLVGNLFKTILSAAKLKDHKTSYAHPQLILLYNSLRKVFSRKLCAFGKNNERGLKLTVLTPFVREK
jgi:hypothetical protein